MLDDWSGMDVEQAARFILSCGVRVCIVSDARRAALTPSLAAPTELRWWVWHGAGE